MTPREKLQLSYEIAFFPPRLNEVWARIRAGAIQNNEETAELLDTALHHLNPHRIKIPQPTADLRSYKRNRGRSKCSL